MEILICRKVTTHPQKKEITSIRRIQIDVIVAYFYKVVNEKILLLASSTSSRRTTFVFCHAA